MLTDAIVALATPPERIAAQLELVAAAVDRLLATAPAGERLREGALLVLAGRPNAGKSSLFNALLGADRALVSELPGTTRDTIEAHTSFLGWPVRLADTAGLWEAESHLDRLGVEVSRRYLAAADLVLLCVDAARPLDAAELRIACERPTLLLHTKADLAAASQGDALRVSATTGDGLDALRRTAGEAVLVAHHVRDATRALDELIGAVDVEEVLGRIFATMCVGK